MLKQSERGVLAIVGFLGLVGLLSVEAYRSDISVTKDLIGALIDVVEHLEQIGEIDHYRVAEDNRIRDLHHRCLEVQ